MASFNTAIVSLSRARSFISAEILLHSGRNLVAFRPESCCVSAGILLRFGRNEYAEVVFIAIGRLLVAGTRAGSGAAEEP